MPLCSALKCGKMGLEVILRTAEHLESTLPLCLLSLTRHKHYTCRGTNGVVTGDRVTFSIAGNGVYFFLIALAWTPFIFKVTCKPDISSVLL